jgi:hypothetical protein
MDQPTEKAARVSRRRFLRIVGVAGLGALAASKIRWVSTLDGTISFASHRARPALWSDPATWGGRVPGTGDVAIVSKRIVLDLNARVGGVLIKRKGELVFHPQRSVALRSRGNVVVRGRLSMRPRRPFITHRLLFPNIDERRFVGGGMRVLTSDVGVWVTGKGQVDVAGSSKLAWTRAAGPVPAGSTSLSLRDAPTGWRVGDEVILTPTVSPATPGHDVAYDIGTLVAIDRLTRRITLRSPTKIEHPAVEVEPGVVHSTEVLNLTRNARIEGSLAGRSHIWIRSSRPQSFQNATLQFMGPRRGMVDAPPFSTPVLGRYGLHFHQMGSASRGSLVKGVVVRDSGNHAFVTHRSDGVTFRDCITHNTFEEAYWWDPSSNPDDPNAPPSNDVLYDRCVASLVKSDPPTESFYRLTGFFLGARRGNVIRNCVAVGVQGGLDSSGFLWPEYSPGLWKFQDCLAHNNRSHGITAWQNNSLPNIINRFTAYHNGRFGILHGFYSNGFAYADSILYANGEASVVALAVSVSSPLQVFSGMRCDQAGLSPHCVVGAPRVLLPAAPVHFNGCRFRGYSKAAFGFVDPTPFPHFFNIKDCSFDRNEFWLGSDIYPASRIRVSHPALGMVTLRRADQPGEYHSEWNASVSRIS